MNENNSNLLFIIPGFLYIGEYQKSLYHNSIPLSTLQLSSLLKERQEIKTQIIDLRFESEIDSNLEGESSETDKFKDPFIKVLENSNIQDFNNIGINCYTSYQFLYTDLISRIIKEEFSNINIILGGYHPTAVPEDFAYQGAPYDFIIRGEADTILLDLFDSKILNKVNSHRKPQILKSEKLIDINSLPFPDYDLFMNKYPYKDRFTFDFYMSRGCPYQCAFCATNFEFRSLTFQKFQENFEKLLEIVERYNIKIPKVGFADQSFNRVQISQKILDYILLNEFQHNFTFSCQSRIETIANKFELIDKFRKCGMLVGYGLESVNKNLLKEMHKTDNPLKYIEIAKKIINKYKDSNETYCRLNVLVGFPGENQDTFNETLNFINDNALHENIQIGPSLFFNYPNVYVYQNMEYYEKKYGSDFIKEWWKLPLNPLKNAVPNKTSEDYSKKQLIYDYTNEYISILKVFKRDTFASLVSWKRFFNKWYKEMD